MNELRSQELAQRLYEEWQQQEGDSPGEVVADSDLTRDLSYREVLSLQDKVHRLYEQDHSR